MQVEIQELISLISKLSFVNSQIIEPNKATLASTKIIISLLLKRKPLPFV